MTNYPTSTTAQTLGDWAYVAIATHFDTVCTHEAEVLKGKDPEAVHQMRVGMRRLRSAIVGFAPALDLPPVIQCRRIGKVARILGRLRDLDVLSETLFNHYALAIPPQEQKCLEAIAPITRKQHKQRLKSVRRALTHKGHYQTLHTAFNQWLATPTYCPIANAPIALVLADLLAPQVSKFLLHPGFFLPPEAALTEIEILHDLRKLGKETRYQLELFASFYGDPYHTHLKHIKKIQSVLGDLQDSYVLEEFLQYQLKQPLGEALPEVMAQLESDRTKSLTAWRSLQQIYGSPQARHELHQAVQFPLNVAIG